MYSKHSHSADKGGGAHSEMSATLVDLNVPSLASVFQWALFPLINIMLNRS